MTIFIFKGFEIASLSLAMTIYYSLFMEHNTIFFIVRALEAVEIFYSLISNKFELFKYLLKSRSYFLGIRIADK